MDYAFRTFPRTDPPPAGPGELHLRPRSASPQAGRRLACLAVEEGVGAFVRGDGPVRCLVIQGDPTLDDMLAALFVERLLSGKDLPAGAKAFASYAALAREGLKPGDLPLEDSLAGVYLAVRHEAGGDLGEDGPRAQFLADWSELARRVMQAAEEGWNPFSRSLVADDPTFARARAFLARDRDVYTHQDVSRGERWLMRLPGGPNTPVGGLLLGSPPKSVLWKYWAREDPEAPGGRGYLFLAVFEEARHWRFSTDPVHKLAIKSLADKLQAAEAARDSTRAAADPWFDGAPFGHTIVGAPRGGTLLSDAEVLAVVKRWAGVRSAAAPRMLPLTAASILLGCCGLAALAWAVVATRPGKSPDAAPSPSARADDRGAPDSALGVLVTDSTGRQARATVIDNETTPDVTVTAHVNLEPDANTVVFRASRRVSEPVKLRVRVHFPDKDLALDRLSVEVNGKEPATLALKSKPGKWRESDELRAFFNAGANNVITVHADSPLPEEVRAVVELGWQADLSFQRDLHLLALGVSDYQYKQLQLRCAAQDAAAFVKTFQGQEGLLFRHVHAEAMTDAQVRKGDVVKRLAGLAKEVTPDSVVLVTISGHGKKTWATNRYFFLPYDYNPADPPNDRGISWQDFQDCLTGLPCPVILVVDTCHSGAIGADGVKGAGSVSPEELQDAVAEAAKLLKGTGSGIIVMAACLGNEVAQEDPRWGHGALTLALLEGIEGKQLFPGRTELPQKTAGPVITLQDLSDYAVKRVQELAGREQAVVLKPCTDGIHPARIPIAVNLGHKAG
jgi:hypothetical protein